MSFKLDSTPGVGRNSSVSSISTGRMGADQKFGILSQTITSGSQVRWILPARIRSRKHNDVVFVSNSSIQLRECLPDGTLFDATAKLDIGTPIMHAKVISAKLEKIPKEDLVLQQIWDEEQFSVRGKLCTDEQPPQILVLCTDAGDLMYIYALSTNRLNAKFIYAKRSVWPGISHPTNWGRHLAVDPNSKLLALSSSSTVAVCSLEDIDHLKTAIDNWIPRQPASFRPHKEQRFLPVDGTIIRMAFLRSPEDDPEKVFLLVIVAKMGRSNLILYRWDRRESLIHLGVMRLHIRMLPVEDSFPVLLIPASRPLSFWLVTERELVFYDDIRFNRDKRLPTRLDSTAAKDSPLWVQWAKPQRHDEYEKDKEDILLVREDGVTKFFSRTYNPLSSAIVTVSPGEFNMSVDSAICMLSGPRTSGGDIVIVAGVDTDGAVFWLGPREFPQVRQIIPNMSPLRTIFSIGPIPAVAEDVKLPQRAFGISGTGPQTKIHELRFGLEAQGVATIPITDYPTFDRLWAFEQEEEHFLYLVTSNMERTLVIAQDLARPEDLRLVNDDNMTALTLTEETLALAKLTAGPILQITPSMVRVITSSLLNDSFHASHSVDRCVCADIDEETGLFAIASSDASGWYVAIGLLADQESNPHIVMAPNLYRTGRPFCLRLVQINDAHLLGLGFFDGSFQLVSIHPTEGMVQQAAVEGTSDKGIGISAIDILHLKHSSQILVLTGRLDGKLDVGMMELQYTGEHIRCGNFQPRASYTLGLSRVIIRSDALSDASTKSSFVCGDARFARITLVSIGDYVDFSFDEIWLTDRTNMSASQPLIRSISRIPLVKSDPDCEWSRTVLLGTGRDILSTNLVEQRQLVPRMISDSPDARYVEYSSFLHRLVIVRSKGPAQNGDSARRPSIQLLNLDTTSDEGSISGISFGEPGDMVQALLNWSPSNGKTHYNLVMIGLYDGSDCRLGHLNAKKLSENREGSAVFKTVLSLPHSKIHALCEHGSSSLLISAGTQVVLLHLEIEAKKWSQKGRYDLPSHALSLTSRGAFVYAATAMHSMMVFRLDSNHFRLVFTDRSAKNARHVIPFGKDGRHVLLSTENGGGASVFGYMQGSNGSDQPSPSFEAQLPLPINQLLPISMRWTDDEHYAFQGSTLDGTIYQLKTLNLEEYKLLHYLQRIARPDIPKPTRAQLSLLTKKLARTWVSRRSNGHYETLPPSSMHIHGDAIELLINSAGKEVREALGMNIKTEDEMIVDSGNSRRNHFEALAVPVVGHNNDQIGAVLAWAKRLLRSTIL